MLKKTITYKDLDGKDLTEDFYFNLSAAEIAEMELSQNGGLSAHLQHIVGTNDGAQIIETFKSIVCKSHGLRSDDGKRFIKSPAISEEFMQTDAYSVLFLELVTDAEASAAFIKGILPGELQEKLEAGGKVINLPNQDLGANPPWIQENREPTEAEVRSMTHDQLLEAMRQKTATSQKRD